MLASDLHRLEIIGIDHETGFPHFNGARFIVFGLPSLGQLQKDLIHSLGKNKASVIYTRYGLELGMGMAIQIADLYDFDTPEELLKAGGVLQTMMGQANVNIKDIRMDSERKILQFSGTWTNSFESSLWLSQFGPSTHPVCSIMRGMLSGYASAIIGEEVMVRETACQAQGADCCCFEGKTIAEWGLDPEEVRRILAVERIDEELSRLRQELEQTRENIARQNTEIKLLKTLGYQVKTDPEIVFRSASMAKLLITAEKVSTTHATVLIQGESGTGKEVIARFIHRHSASAEKPFLAINCAALPPNLLESELFGHVKGAFTGASSDKKGLFVEAGKGTLFLDEVGEIPLDMQAKLLRALQEKEVRQVGGLKDFPVQARIIAATNRDLRGMVGKGRFREDLYYRLAVFPLFIAPLRERREDILLLARHFLARIQPNHPGFDPKAVRQMEAYSWPGNIRELENLVEYAVIMSGGERILPEHFPQSAIDSSQDPLATLAADLPTMKELMRRYTQFVIKHTGGKRNEAARLLGVGVSTLWRHLKSEEPE